MKEKIIQIFEHNGRLIYLTNRGRVFVVEYIQEGLDAASFSSAVPFNVKYIEITPKF